LYCYNKETSGSIASYKQLSFRNLKIKSFEKPDLASHLIFVLNLNITYITILHISKESRFIFNLKHLKYFLTVFNSEIYRKQEKLRF